MQKQRLTLPSTRKNLEDKTSQGKALPAPAYGVSLADRKPEKSLIQAKSEKGKPKSEQQTLGREPSVKEFNQIQQSIKIAVDMTNLSLDWLTSLIYKLNKPKLPHMGKPIGDKDKPKNLDFFKAHFKSDSLEEIGEIYDNILAIERKLPQLKKSSFRLVSEKECEEHNEKSTEKDESARAFVLPGDSKIYFCPFTKSEAAPIGSEKMTIQQTSPNIDIARFIIHELAHRVLGIGHIGGEFPPKPGECFENGLSLKSYTVARANAYTYDNFIYCIYTKMK